MIPLGQIQTKVEWVAELKHELLHQLRAVDLDALTALLVGLR